MQLPCRLWQWRRNLMYKCYDCGLDLSCPGLFLTALLFAFPGLLFLTVLYYSLTTPFGLIDDYHTLGCWRGGFPGRVGRPAVGPSC